MDNDQMLTEDEIFSLMGNSTDANYDYNISYSCCAAEPCEFETIQAFEGFFLPVFYSLIFVLGLLGNVMVIVVLLRAKERLPGTDVFIFNLAVADVLLVVTLPFWAAQAVHGWLFGDFLCKTLGSIFKINFYASIFFLVCISFDRYLSIVYVIHMYNRRNTTRILYSTLAVWIFCVLLTLPDFIFLTAEFDSRQNSTSCSLSFASSSAKLWKLILSVFNQLVAFFLPLLTMAFCYIRIVVSLLRSKGFQKHKALKVILVVVAVFFLCWTPYHLVQLINTLFALEVLQEDCLWEEKLDIAETITVSLGFFHCCLNPLLYAFVGIKFRTRFIELLEQVGCVSKEFLKSHTRFPSHRRDSSWTESTEASYGGL